MGSALLFALVHLDALVMIGAFVLGLICAGTYQRSRSLWPAVIVHTIYNTIGLVLGYVITAMHTHLPLI